MLIKTTNEPNEETIKELREVERICKEHDGLRGTVFLDTSINFNPEIKSLFLLYKHNKLVSFLSLFMPTSDEAEVSAYTLPEHRRKGYFKILFEEAKKELTKFNLPELVFVCESQSKDGMRTIEKQKLIYDFTEYFLRYNNSLNDRDCCQITEVKLFESKKEDIESLIHLSQEIFNESYDDAKSMIIKSFESENRIQYKAMLDENLIGMGSVSFENDESSIIGLGVSPQYQGKGLGGAIVKLIITDLLSRGREHITIEVDSTNKRAFNLYRKCGFEVETSFDYYRKKL